MINQEVLNILNIIAENIVFFGAVFIPPLFWLWYFRFHDCAHPEPLKLLTIVFFMGSGVALALRGVFWFFDIPNLYIFSTIGWFGLLGKSILFILFLAFLEEVLKFVVLRFYVYHQKDFDERIDGVIYGVTVGLGFATLENILYIISYGPEVVFSRFATATLLHALLGGIMGSFLTQNKFDKKHNCCMAIRAILLSTALHFVYNMLIVYNISMFNGYFEVAWVFIIFVVLLYIVHRIKKRDCFSY